MTQRVNYDRVLAFKAAGLTGTPADTDVVLEEGIGVKVTDWDEERDVAVVSAGADVDTSDASYVGITTRKLTHAEWKKSPIIQVVTCPGEIVRGLCNAATYAKGDLLFGGSAGYLNKVTGAQTPIAVAMETKTLAARDILQVMTLRVRRVGEGAGPVAPGGNLTVSRNGQRDIAFTGGVGGRAGLQYEIVGDARGKQVTIQNAGNNQTARVSGPGTGAGNITVVAYDQAGQSVEKVVAVS